MRKNGMLMSKEIRSLRKLNIEKKKNLKNMQIKEELLIQINKDLSDNAIEIEEELKKLHSQEL
jgi:hypothetical protein